MRPLLMSDTLSGSARTTNGKRRKQGAHFFDYIGEVGERVTVDVAEMNLLTSWENDYGYTFLYKIVDVLGNVLIWYSSKCVDPMKRLKASIKSHSERDGVKQTIVTRCTAVA